MNMIFPMGKLQFENIHMHHHICMSIYRCVWGMGGSVDPLMTGPTLGISDLNCLLMNVSLSLKESNVLFA